MKSKIFTLTRFWCSDKISKRDCCKKQRWFISLLWKCCVIAETHCSLRSNVILFNQFFCQFVIVCKTPTNVVEVNVNFVGALNLSVFENSSKAPHKLFAQNFNSRFEMSIAIKPFMVLGLFAITCWMFLGEFADGFDRYTLPGGFRGARKPSCIKWGNETLWEVYLEAFPRLNYPFPIQTSNSPKTITICFAVQPTVWRSHRLCQTPGWIFRNDRPHAIDKKQHRHHQKRRVQNRNHTQGKWWNKVTKSNALSFIIVMIKEL